MLWAALLVVGLLHTPLFISGQQSPCVPCQNGGVCNRSKLQTVYGDVYGTCICPRGYSGTSCETNDLLSCTPTCQHNGTCVGGVCSCPSLTLGTTCDTIACGFQAARGVGPSNSTYPDAKGNCGECDVSHNGPYCRNTLKCPEGLRLNKGVIGVGHDFSYSCTDRTSDMSWAQLIQGYTTVLIYCNKMSPWENSTSADGTCTVNFMREGYVSRRREELFSCSMSECFETVKRVDKTANPTYDASQASITEVPVSIAFRSLIAISAVCTAFAVLFAPNSKLRVVFWVGLVLLSLNCALYCAAAVPSMVATGSGTVQLIASSAAPRPVAEIQCGTINCACNMLASDQPNCNLPTFAQYLRGLTGTSKLTCDNTTDVCIFSNANFFQGTVQLGFQCNVSSCTDYEPQVTVSAAEIVDASTTSDVGVGIAALAGVLLMVAAVAVIVWCSAGLVAKPVANRSYTASERVLVNCSAISYGDEKKILDNVTGWFISPGITALLGPSGAGKSTLLDILGMRQKELPVSGQVAICGVSEPQWALRRCIAYANDGPCFIDTLTVRESLADSCKLRSAKALDETYRAEVVEWLINVFRLESVADTRVERLSAGETRRLRVATALSGFPNVLLLDEPTSGLDSANARLVLQTLRAAITDRFSRAGANEAPVTIVTVHQPSAELLQLFDEVAVLGRGKLAFQGPLQELHRWIELVEPAKSDLAAQAIDLVSARDDLPDCNLRPMPPCGSPEAFTESLRAKLHSGLAPHQQVAALLQRNMTTLIRKPGIICLHFLISTVVALALSFMYQDVTKDATGIIAKAGLVSFNFLWIALTQLSVMDVVHSERAAVVADRYHSLYTSVSYLIAKLFTDVLVLRILPTVVGTCLIYFPTGFRIEASAFFSFLGVQLLFTLCMTSIATAFAARSETFGVATLGYGFFVILAFAFGGFVSQGGSMPAALSWISYLSPFYLGFNVIMTTDLEQQLCIFTPRDATGSPTSTTLTLACSQYLFTLGISPSEKDLDAGLLSLWTLLTLIGAACCVEFMFHTKR